MAGHVSPISGVACYQDKWIATAGYDNQIILWDAKTNKVIAKNKHLHLANQCAFNKDGEFLVSTSSDHTAAIWELPNLNLIASLSGHSDDVESVAITENSKFITTSSRDHTIRLWDIAGNCLRVLTGHEQDVISVEFLEDTNSAGIPNIISSSDDGTVKIWNANSGEIIKDIDLGGVETDTLSVLSVDRIYAGNDKGEIVCLHNLKRVSAHNAGIKRLILDARKNLLISLSYDRTVRFWQILPDGNLQLQDSATFPAVVWPRSAASLENGTLVFATFGSSYAIFDPTTHLWHLEHITNTHGINGINSYGKDIYTIGDAGIVQKNGKKISDMGSLCNFILPLKNYLFCGGQMGAIFDGSSGEILYQHFSPLNCAVAIDNEKMICFGTYTGELIFLKLSGDKYVFSHSNKVHINAIKGVAYDGEHIFSVSADTSVAFSLPNGIVVKYIENAHLRIINSCVNVGVGIFASVSRDRSLKIFASSGLVQTYQIPVQHSVKCVTSDNKGYFIACGSYRGEIAIFDVSLSCFVFLVRVTAHGVSALTYSEEQKAFLASSYDGKVYEIPVQKSWEKKLA